MIDIFRDERDRLIHRGPVRLRQSRQATASRPGTLLLVCPYGHLVDTCETGTPTASAWIAAESFGHPRVVDCGGTIPAPPRHVG